MTLRKSMFLVGVLFVAAVLLTPTEAFAQAAIAGVARDETGAVMPGVTVEAASPALIEKVRVVYTDASGLYRISDLRPGQYSVTFSLAGFSTFKRDGITLSGAAVATVNGEMRVGAIEETLTVTGEAPLVDVPSTTKEQVLNKDLLEAIPTGRQVWTSASRCRASRLNGTDVGGAGGIQQERIAVHGAGSQQTTIEIDGMIVQPNQNNSVQQYFNDGVVQEVAVQTSGNSAETQRGGVRLNMIPETGGNTFAGAIVVNAVPNESWNSSNYTAGVDASRPPQRARGRSTCTITAPIRAGRSIGIRCGGSPRSATSSRTTPSPTRSIRTPGSSPSRTTRSARSRGV